MRKKLTSIENDDFGYIQMKQTLLALLWAFVGASLASWIQGHDSASLFFTTLALIVMLIAGAAYWNK